MQAGQSHNDEFLSSTHVVDLTVQLQEVQLVAEPCMFMSVSLNSHIQLLALYNKKLVHAYPYQSGLLAELPH